ncbi:MAG: bifunctional riboflavin kinase/FAD synthetase [Sandaracinus sp.]|nr:bifunctional riboflavin kinase/FAD synthetase [Sandaracinus sp.]MCB9623027.1 bifunctional riboflavin kinase/FAD synthetase [Sandaracinus sp.]
MASVLTPGNFDGVHLGHRALVTAAAEGARRRGCRAVAMFFDPHPITFFRPDEPHPQLTTVARRSELLARVGADVVDVRRFDAEFAALSPEEFVRDALVRPHGLVEIVVGADFRFGRGRAGDVETLRALGNEHGFEVTLVEPVDHDGGVVSSTRIRGLLADGAVGAASRLLSRFHDVDGVVVEGDRRGRTIGFPTANLRVEGMLPADGVYAVLCRIPGETELRRGVANLGNRPTFEAGRSVEVHLLDFAGDLYGRTLRVGFVERLRGEVRFAGIEALVAQLNADVEAGRAALDAAEPEHAGWI